MKPSLLLLPVGLASASVAPLAIWDSWFKKTSVSTAQEKLLKQVSASYKTNYKACMDAAYKIQKWCEIKDIEIMEKSIDKCMDPINKILENLKFVPGVVLNGEFSAGVKIDPLEIKKALTGLPLDGCKACLNGPKSLSDIKF